MGARLAAPPRPANRAGHGRHQQCGPAASEPYDFTAGTPVTGAEVSGDIYGWRALIPQGSQSTAANGGLTVYAVCSA
jgi:hypothetical protein